MRILNKVPEITASFWVIKVLATTVGETAADFLNVDLGLGLVVTSAAMAVLLAAALVVQFRVRRYVPAIYWLAVVLISVAGTLITDNLVDTLGVPLWVTATVFATALTATFVIWFRVERSLSIHSIQTPRREAFYWLAVLCTFALGTAVGDLLAQGADLGLLVSVLVFGGAIASVAVAFYFFRTNAITAFWVAYVLTRPFGASLGDLLSQSPDSGGLGMGATGTSSVFLAMILALVVALSVRARSGRSGHQLAA